MKEYQHIYIYVQYILFMYTYFYNMKIYICIRINDSQGFYREKCFLGQKLNRSILFRGKLAKLQSKTSFVWLNLLQKIQTATQAEKCKKNSIVIMDW